MKNKTNTDSSLGNTLMISCFFFEYGTDKINSTAFCLTDRYIEQVKIPTILPLKCVLPAQNKTFQLVVANVWIQNVAFALQITQLLVTKAKIML
ncbi:MAG: hypothetical protein GY757_49645 [bacterium]|nr:hypothetical protein [bacterium]